MVAGIRPKTIMHCACAWHIIVKNLDALMKRDPKVKCSKSETKLLWKIVDKTNLEKGERLLADLHHDRRGEAR